MDDGNWLAERFEENRSHLRAVAYRMLGSVSEADDAVQECWLRLSRSDTSEVDNLGGWLTTVVARLCLDMLRSRQSRREEPLGGPEPGPVAVRAVAVDPEDEAVMADSVGLALLVVLDTLAPAERLAFVLHDLFAIPFDQIGPIMGRSVPSARQLASRARRRVHGAPLVADADLARQREVVDAFLAASRRGDFEALVAMLDPDVVLHADRAGVAAGVSAAEVCRGAAVVAERALLARAAFARPALVNGAVGVVVAPGGRLLLVIGYTIVGDKIVAIDLVGDPERLRHFDLAVLDD